MLKNIKSWLRSRPTLYRLFRLIRLRLKVLMGGELSASERIEQAFKGGGAVRFLQVGSNDGRFGDPICRLIKTRGNWSGVFVEPVPYAYERLVKNYGIDPKYTFEKVAISACREKKTFFYVSEAAKEELGDDLPVWYDQLGSFDKEHILKHLDGILAPYVVGVEIECEPIKEVLERNSITSLDLVHIDTEGFDYQVLKQIDLSSYRPQLILFEHKHLSPSERLMAKEMLENAGYRLAEIDGDTLAER